MSRLPSGGAGHSSGQHRRVQRVQEGVEQQLCQVATECLHSLRAVRDYIPDLRAM